MNSSQHGKSKAARSPFFGPFLTCSHYVITITCLILGCQILTQFSFSLDLDFWMEILRFWMVTVCLWMETDLRLAVLHVRQEAQEEIDPEKELFLKQSSLAQCNWLNHVDVHVESTRSTQSHQLDAIESMQSTQYSRCNRLNTVDAIDSIDSIQSTQCN